MVVVSGDIYGKMVTEKDDIEGFMKSKKVSEEDYIEKTVVTLIKSNIVKEVIVNRKVDIYQIYYKVVNVVVFFVNSKLIHNIVEEQVYGIIKRNLVGLKIYLNIYQN